MWGENSSGKRISLLNNDSLFSSRPRPSPPPQSSHIHYHKSYRPTLPDRSRNSDSSSSTSIASTASLKSCSSRSSISRSPGHSPPTPPLTRLDTLSTINTKIKTTSSMTPRYGFEPSDSTQHKHMNLPYYQTLGKPQGFGALPDAPVPNPYYHLQGQQPLPPLDPLSLDDAYPIPTSLHRLQTQQLSHFSTGPSLHQFPPTPHDSAHLTSPNSAFLPTPASAFQQQPPALSNHRPSISTSIAPIAAATTSPAKSSPTAPSKSAAANSPSNSNAAGPPKKKYPCPHATAFNCSDTFTTSGHAARHGKKHTGEKNVQCPTCGKAFTRKDNMKQHERTHKGANAHSTAPTTTQSSHSRVPSGSASPASVVKTPVSASRSRRTSDVLRAQSSTPGASVASPTDDAMDLDVTTSSGAGRQSMMAPMVPQMGGGGGGGSKNERPRMPRSELSEILENVQNSGVADGVGEADAEGESPGLDALALAAGQA